MTTDSENKRSSSFDRMLDENRRQFDALLTRRAAASRPERPAEPARTDTPAPRSSPPASAPPKASTGAEPFDIRATDIGQTLARRFGADWRFEVVDTRRDGEDIVVWARLTAGAHDKTRRGRARIEGRGEAASVSGSAAGTAFSLQAGQGTGDDPAAAEAAATEEAARQALAACAKGL